MGAIPTEPRNRDNPRTAFSVQECSAVRWTEGEQMLSVSAFACETRSRSFARFVSRHGQEEFFGGLTPCANEPLVTREVRARF
jgi:hypothetical protein